MMMYSHDYCIAWAEAGLPPRHAAMLYQHSKPLLLLVLLLLLLLLPLVRLPRLQQEEARACRWQLYCRERPEYKQRYAVMM